MLVSYPLRFFRRARSEVIEVLKILGDEEPEVERTIVSGIMGVKTGLDPKEIVKKLRELYERDPLAIQYTFKWIPIEKWVESDIDSMKNAIEELVHQIRENESWRMTVEKRRYNKLHKIEIIRELAELIDRKVDLENPDKIVQVEIIGKYAGISVLQPNEIFSSMGLP